MSSISGSLAVQLGAGIATQVTGMNEIKGMPDSIIPVRPRLADLTVCVIGHVVLPDVNTGAIGPGLYTVVLRTVVCGSRCTINIHTVDVAT